MSFVGKVKLSHSRLFTLGGLLFELILVSLLLIIIGPVVVCFMAEKCFKRLRGSKPIHVSGREPISIKVCGKLYINFSRH